jgi:methylmalonyl-CoA mutase, N-terminal domain
VLGGTQSLHTDAMDEALALPSEQAVTVALRTQQIIAEESGVINTIDPLGGSYFVEALTDEMERQVLDYFQRIEELGGVEAALESGWIQHEIADASYRYQREVDDGRRTSVGVNAQADDEPLTIPILAMDPEGESKHLARLNRVRGDRDQQLLRRRLDELRTAAEADANLMYPILDAVRAYATLGEICDVLREVFGVYHEQIFV